MSDFDTQLKNAIDKFREFSKEAETGIEKALVKAALVIEGDAKKNAPVDTGRLHDSITHRLGDENGQSYAEVGTSVDYGIFQEFGTSKMPAHPFLTPAFEANKETITAYLAKVVKEAADNAGR